MLRAAPAEALRIVPLDALTAIYDRRSGQTHIVTEPVPQLLAALAEPADPAALIARLGLAEDASTRAILEERFNELIASGLVEGA